MRTWVMKKVDNKRQNDVLLSISITFDTNSQVITRHAWYASAFSALKPVLL